MKKTIAILSLMVTILGIVGCGRGEQDYTNEQSGMVNEPYTEADTIQPDYSICVDGINVDINQYDGYKPYVLVFRTKKDEIFYNTHVFFDSPERDGSRWSLDYAKQKGLIQDYYYDAQNSILVFYFNKSEDCTLMPISRHYEMEFGSIDTYWMMWNDACMKKIGLGGSYQKMEISPYIDFEEDEEVCVKKVVCEGYSHAPMGSTVSQWFTFIDSIIDMDYTISDIE